MSPRTPRTARFARSLGAATTAVLAAVLLAPTSLAAAAPASLEAGAAARAARPTKTDGCVTSVPEPGERQAVRICYTLFRPAGASAKQPVPMIMHSHGWGGSRETELSAFDDFLGAGYGVLSYDQRGWGESGGHAHVESPQFEGEDEYRLVQLISRLSWVQQDGPGDPRLGAIGGSYGGGYQFLGAFDQIRRTGRQVFDALAPEITWNDLSGSIAPNGVVRTAWAAALSAASIPSDALPANIYKALVEGAATGEWPDGSLPGGEDVVSFFAQNGPKFHVDAGRRLDIPVLFGQGTTDSLFPLEQGLTNWRTALTPRARKRSIFVGYNGGHVLPSVLPAGVSVTSDPCSRKLAGSTFRALSIRFFDEQLKGRRTGLSGYGRLHLATPESKCFTVDSPDATDAVPLGTVVSTTAAGAPLPYDLGAGPMRIAGTPWLEGDLTAVGVKNRAFYGLAVGTTPLSAKLVQDNVLPVNRPRTQTGVPVRVALPSVAVNVARGEHLYLLVSPLSDTFVGMGSRTPGLITLDNTVVHLPVMGR